MSLNIRTRIPRTTPSPRWRVCALLAAGALAAGVVGCGADNDSAASTQASAVELTDQWVKAADSGMTAAFGTLRNTSDSEVRLTGGSTDVAARVEIHETVDAGSGMVMRPVEGGLVIPADGTAELAPGLDHIMLMDLTRPITAGETVTITLRFADGSTEEVTARARDFSGNQEDYQHG